MTDLQIGQWVRRHSQKWHLVESVVAGDVVTRCGRRMDRVARFARRRERAARFGELQVSVVMPLTRMIGQPQLCKAGCEAFEEDRSAMEVEIATHSTTPSSEFVTLDEGTSGLSFEDDGSTAPVDAPDVP